MLTDQQYTISELATLAGVTPRTIRYYVSIGLLPSPGQAGPGTRYGAGHLARLRLIRRLQRDHLPLGEVAARLEGLDDATVEAALAAAEWARDGLGQAAEPGATAGNLLGPAPGSALEYIQRLKEAQRRTPGTSSGPSTPLMAGPMPQPPTTPPSTQASLAISLRRAMLPDRAEPEEPLGAQRSQWERVTLSQNVELHVRRPLGRLEQKQVERLIRLGRELLEGGQPR